MVKESRWVEEKAGFKRVNAATILRRWAQIDLQVYIMQKVLYGIRNRTSGIKSGWALCTCRVGSC